MKFIIDTRGFLRILEVGSSGEGKLVYRCVLHENHELAMSIPSAKQLNASSSSKNDPNDPNKPLSWEEFILRYKPLEVANLTEVFWAECDKEFPNKFDLVSRHRIGDKTSQLRYAGHQIYLVFDENASKDFSIDGFWEKIHVDVKDLRASFYTPKSFTKGIPTLGELTILFASSRNNPPPGYGF